METNLEDKLTDINLDNTEPEVLHQPDLVSSPVSPEDISPG